MPNPKSDRKTPPGDILAAAQRHDGKAEAVLEVLKDVQAEKGCVSPAAIGDIATALHMPAHKAFGVATFYSMLSLAPRQPQVLRVCDGPVCWLKRSSQPPAETEGYTVERSSCLGLCDRAPAALMGEEQVGPERSPERPASQRYNRSANPVYAHALPGELRVMLANSGKIDPDSITSALEHGAYRGLQAALEKSPEAVIAEVEASGLSGRGGAGFPVGRKWRFVAQSQRTPKYILCNADESEPLIFKDRVLMETNPHQLIEGMAIAGYACGATEGIIYIRGEYEAQAQRLERAIAQAEELGLLGGGRGGGSGDHDPINAAGNPAHPFEMHIHVHRGAGAYICGEETALIESLEGKRGEPRLRPPYPPTFGYRGLPSLVNNVESYSAAPAILLRGAAWYRGLNPKAGATPGTKLYMVLGHVNQPGLFEAPFGITLRQAIEEFGGGMLPGSTFKFALTGGAAGTIVPAELLDTPLDYPSAALGVSLGAGAVLVCDQSVSALAFLREELRFFAAESCGKCTPCRVGSRRAFDILSRMSAGQRQAGDATELHQLADVMGDASFCGLGQSIPIPMKSALRWFGAEFEV